MFDIGTAAEQARFDAVAEGELLAAQAYLAQLDALLLLHDAHEQDAWSRAADPRGDQVVEEAASASHLTAWSVERRLNQALAVRAVPVLRDLLLAGRLGVPHSVAAIEETTGYGTELAVRVLHEVLLGDDPGWEETPPKLVVALRRCALRLDPEGCALRRAEREIQSTGVRLQALRDGLAKLSATGNAVSVRAAHTLLAHLAKATGPDDERTTGQRQLDALCSALVTAAGGAVPVELQLEVPVHAAAPAAVPAPGSEPLDPVVVRSDLTDELLALLTGTPAPAAVRGPSEAEPDVAGPDLVEPETLPDVVPTAGESGSARSGTEPRGRVGRRRPRDGVDELAGVGPVDPDVLRELLRQDRPYHGLPAGLAGITVRRLCVDPTGQVISADPVAVPLARLLATAAAPPTGSGRRRGRDPAPHVLSGQLLRALTSALPRVPGDTSAYRPTAAQQRVVRARDPHCTFPGCRRPARGCELDHRDAYPAGATSTVNLHPLCKHHHDLKHQGWRPHRHADGSTTWTSPGGQRRRVRAG